MELHPALSVNSDENILVINSSLILFFIYSIFVVSIICNYTCIWALLTGHSLNYYYILNHFILLLLYFFKLFFFKFRLTFKNEKLSIFYLFFWFLAI